jgi:hypothetical protein
MIRPLVGARAEGEKMNDDPEVIRNRAANTARLAANALPPGIELKLKWFWYWNGDPPAPEFTHWTPRGVFAIRAHTPRKVASVLFRGVYLGFADYHPMTAARNLFEGAFDKELGFGASEFVPPTLAGWNDLGG